MAAGYGRTFTHPAGASRMKFHFENIGPIRKAELELGDFTVIAGRNNTGKTYLAYTLYGFLKNWRGWPDILSFLLSEEPNGAQASADLDRQVLREMTASLAASGEAHRVVDRDTLARERDAVAVAVTQSFSETQLASVFSVPSREFEGAHFGLSFGTPFEAPEEPLTIRFGKDDRWEIGYDDNRILVRRLGPQATRQVDASVLPFLYVTFLLSELPIPFILSAERFGISLFYKELDFTKNQLVDMLQKLRDKDKDRRFSPFMLIDQTSRYALPIKDNIDYTRGISDLKNRQSEIYGSKLYGDIKDMMNGYYSASNDEIRFVSKQRKAGKFNIALHRASSSARGLSDLYFFLRHVARKNHLLIVDEPESHLDTANQVGLARLLANLVGAGVRVLVTTHSDYLVKEMNNLIMQAELGDAGLDRERVRAYVAEGGSLRQCEVDRYGIEMPVFDETIDDINRRSRENAARVLEREEQE